MIETYGLSALSALVALRWLFMRWADRRSWRRIAREMGVTIERAPRYHVGMCHGPPVDCRPRPTPAPPLPAIRALRGYGFTMEEVVRGCDRMAGVKRDNPYVEPPDTIQG